MLKEDYFATTSAKKCAFQLKTAGNAHNNGTRGLRMKYMWQHGMKHSNEPKQWLSPFRCEFKA